jgi:hypothetical protein
VGFTDIADITGITGITDITHIVDIASSLSFLHNHNCLYFETLTPPGSSCLADQRFVCITPHWEKTQN